MEQLTPEWEEVIYEVEQELDEQLKDEPRGPRPQGHRVEKPVGNEPQGYV